MSSSNARRILPALASRLVRLALLAVERTPPLRRLVKRRAEDAAGSERIAFVCYGNINRSAVAAGLARTRWPQREIIEAGHHAIEGSRSSDEAILAASASGIDLSDHRAARLAPQILVQADAVFVFDARDLIAIARANPRSCRKLHLLGALAPTGPLQIKDPHGHGPDAYASTFTQIAAALGRAPR